MNYREIQSVLFLIGVVLIGLVLFIENFFLHNWQLVLLGFASILFFHQQCEKHIQKDRMQKKYYQMSVKVRPKDEQSF